GISLDCTEIGVFGRVGHHPYGTYPVHGVAIRSSAFNNGLGWMTLAQAGNDAGLHVIVMHGRDIDVQQSVSCQGLLHMMLHDIARDPGSAVKLAPTLLDHRKSDSWNTEQITFGCCRHRT